MRKWTREAWTAVLLGGLLASATACASRSEAVTVESLLLEMADFENLARRPLPIYKHAQASSYDRESRKGGAAWFANHDVGQYVRTERVAGRTEHVLADLAGPGAVTRFWSAHPDRTDTVRFYFDGEARPRLEIPLAALFTGATPPFGPDFSYVSGTGGNLYYPVPFASSLKVTAEETDRPLRLYYEIGHRSYPAGTKVETFDPGRAGRWADLQARVARRLAAPEPAPAPEGEEWIIRRLTVPPGETRGLDPVRGEKAVFEWSARVLGAREEGAWDAPERAHNALRALVLDIRCDGERSVATPLGDFFGSGPGVNPYENLFFTVDGTGRMTSRLLMPFRRSLELSLSNAGRIPYEVELVLRVGAHDFTDRTYHLRAQWRTLTRDSWPPFDTTVLDAAGEGKLVGSVYEVANDGLVWWGEGDQKIAVDGEPFPSTFGTGTEDDYGYAYGDNRPFTRPYHAQTRVDGPASGGHISLNRWYVLDALPYRAALRFDQEVWHWMPCRPTWGHVVYWYAAPGTPGPAAVDRAGLAPVDLGPRAAMLDPVEGEALRFEARGGAAGRERLANCSGAEHLVWRGARPGDRLTVHFTVLRAGRYAVELNLCKWPEFGRHAFAVNGTSAAAEVDCYSPALGWTRPQLGVFDLKEGDNVLEVRALAPNPAAGAGSALGLDYIFLIGR